MTTIDAAAAWRTMKLVTFAAFVAFFGVSLSGCGTTTNIFPTGSDSQSSSLTSPVGSTQLAAASGTQKVAIAPVIGAPDVIAKHLRTQLGQALAKSSIAVATNPNEKAAYTLRGYVVSAREKANTKISYIWDVTDATGKRVNRISGEELAPAGNGSDPWAAMTPQVVQAITTKTASSLKTWLPTQIKTAAASAKTVPGQAAQAVGGGVASAAQQGVNAVAATNAAVGTTTGSINKAGAVSALIPSVTGAPGDGGVSLTNAIRRELSTSGITMASNATAATYQVVGRVKMGQGSAGKQPIQIDWDVRDPAGKKLGTVSQKNDIPQGSLNGAWGKTADAAAAAATQGILKLLPKPTSTN